VPDLRRGVAWFAEATGVEPAPGGRHIGRGTANYLVGLGGAAYLEIIGPDPAEADPPPRLTFGLERIDRPVLITWAVAVDDIEAAIARSRARGYDPGPATTMSRRTVDGELLEWRLTADTTGDGGGLVPFLIDWGATIHPTARGLAAVELASFRAVSSQPDRIRELVGVLGIDLDLTAGEVDQLNAVVRTPKGAVALN
jgi:Glyoxalase-like domain